MSTRFQIRFVQAGYWTITQLAQNDDGTWSVTDILEFNIGVTIAEAFAIALKIHAA